MIRLTKIFDFEMAHALPGYDGSCKNIHGHSFRLEVTVQGLPLQQSGHPKDGMVIDFKDLKAIVNREVVSQFDHALLLPQHAPADLLETLRQYSEKVVLLPFQPTSENLILYIVDKLRGAMPAGVTLQKIRLYETATSFAEWEAV